MVLLIFPQHSQAGANIHRDDVERILRTLEKGFIRTTLGQRVLITWVRYLRLVTSSGSWSITVYWM